MLTGAARCLPQSFGRYNKRDTLNLARFISIAKVPYLL